MFASHERWGCFLIDPVAALPGLASPASGQGQATPAPHPAGAPATQAERDIAGFRRAVASATDPDSLLRDPASLSFILTAAGLGDQARHPALARNALLSDTSEPASLAARLPDPRWVPLAQKLDFAHSGLKALRAPHVLDSLADAYAVISWQLSLDQTKPGLNRALEFRARAAGVTSVVQILEDPNLRAVVTEALGIPAEIALQSLVAQEQAVTRRLDLSDLKDAKFVDSVAQRYLLATDTGPAEPLTI